MDTIRDYYDDKKTFKLLSRGDTIGVFQLENYHTRQLLRQLKPTNIEELAAVNALLRPGAKDSKQDKIYLACKNGQQEPDYLHPKLSQILKPTYGVMLYQETIIAVAKELAGWSLEKADQLRAAIGKKKIDLMNQLIDEFIQDCKKQDISEDVIQRVVEVFKASSRYSFNKCISDITVLRTDRGPKTVEEIKFLLDHKQDVYVLSFDLNKYVEKFVKVKEVINTGIQDVYLIHFNSGEQIECTEEHKFLTTSMKYKTIAEIINKHEQVVLYDILTGRLGVAKVIYYQPAGLKQTYNIEVADKHHNYFIGSLISANSHAVAYSMISYQDAYFKANYPEVFYLASLSISYTGKKRDLKEIQKLYYDAKQHNINIRLPKKGEFDENFKLHNQEIIWGLKYIKNINVKEIPHIVNILNSFEQFDQILVEFKQHNISKNSVSSLAYAGLLDIYNTLNIPSSSFRQMLIEIYNILPDKHTLDKVFQTGSIIASQNVIERIINTSLNKRTSSISKFATKYDDMHKNKTFNRPEHFSAWWEAQYLGVVFSDLPENMAVIYEYEQRNNKTIITAVNKFNVYNIYTDVVIEDEKELIDISSANPRFVVYMEDN